MRIIVYTNEGWDQGFVWLNRALADDEPMDAHLFAEQVAAEYDQEIDNKDGHIPNCCGDIRVEFIEHEPNIVDGFYQGSTVIWSGESFYFKREG